MKIKYLIASMLVIGLLSCSDDSDSVEDKELAKPVNDVDKFSYVIGNSIGSRMKQDSIDPNFDYLIRGVKDALYSDSTLLTMEEMQKTMMELDQKTMGQQQGSTDWDEEKIKSEGDKYLAENKKKPGVKTTPSGLQYEILEPGKGKKPTLEDWIQIKLRGYFVDGQEFDNTNDKRPEGVEVPVNDPNFLPGWKEAWTMMREGAKWRIVLPPSLGVGAQGAPPIIPPNAVLIYEMELVKILENMPRQQAMPQNAPAPPPPPKPTGN